MSLRKLRLKVLEEWRRYPETPTFESRSARIGDVLDKVLQQFGLSGHLQEEKVLQAWNDLVGDFIAANATPIRFKDRILYVRVLQPAVHCELERCWKAQILQKFKSQFGTRTIQEIKFRIG